MKLTLDDESFSSNPCQKKHFQPEVADFAETATPIKCFNTTPSNKHYSDPGNRPIRDAKIGQVTDLIDSNIA